MSIRAINSVLTVFPEDSLAIALRMIIFLSFFFCLFKRLNITSDYAARFDVLTGLVMEKTGEFTVGNNNSRSGLTLLGMAQSAAIEFININGKHRQIAKQFRKQITVFDRKCSLAYFSQP